MFRQLNGMRRCSFGTEDMDYWQAGHRHMTTHVPTYPVGTRHRRRLLSACRATPGAGEVAVLERPEKARKAHLVMPIINIGYAGLAWMVIIGFRSILACQIAVS